MDYITSSLPPNEEESRNIDEKIFNYRKRYKKCKYCKYLTRVIARTHHSQVYSKCVAKDKIIKDELPDMTNILRFCSCYEVDKNK